MRSAARAATVVSAVSFSSRSKIAASDAGGVWTAQPRTYHGPLIYAEFAAAKSLNAVRESRTLENGDVGNDGLTLTYEPRDDIYFHDGVRSTCRDFGFSWKAAIDPGPHVDSL